MGDELLDEVINGVAGLDEEDDFTRPLQLGSEFLDGVSTLDIGSYKPKRPLIDHERKGSQGRRLTLGFVGEEIINLGNGSVVGNDVEALVVDVQDEVLTLLEGGICGENLCDMEMINLTMTAKPMRPISPLEIDKDGE